MPDSVYGAPQATGGGGIGGYFAEHPWAKWVALGGVAALAYWLYARHQNTTAVAGGGTTDTTTANAQGPAYLVNPTTNLPINPYTGQDFGQVASASSDIGAWTSAALKALQASGSSAAESENAIYRFLNGLSLTPAQRHMIDTALAQVGAAPGGPYPIVTPPTPVVAPPQGRYLNPVTWIWNNTAPATVAVGTGLLANLGFLGRGQILTPRPGTAIYAKVRQKNGSFIWRRITSLAQYVNLPTGTQIAGLKGQPPVAAAA